MNDSDPPEGPDAPVGESASGRSDTGRRPSSRRAVLATGVAVLASLAGCPDALAGTNGPDRRTTTPASADAGAPTETTAPDATGPTTAEPAPAATQAPALTVAPDGDLVRPMGRAVSVWNGNPGPDDYWQWPRPGQPDTDRRLADHFAADRGLAPTGERGRPPVLVATSRLDPTARVTGVADGAPDVFTLGPTRPYGESLVAETLPDSEAERLTTAPVARGGQAFFLSPAVAEAGVTALAAEEIRRIYRGETENWRAVGGPDRDIHVVAGATSTPNGRMREIFLRRQLAVDVRFGQPRDRLEVTLDRDDAITYLPVGYTRTSLPVVDVVVDGATHDVTDPGYPTTVTHAAHAWDEFDAREGAFVDMLRSPVGQAIVAEEPRLLPYDGEP